MIIKIEDAPAVRHITIDIDFDESGESTTVIKHTDNHQSNTGGTEMKKGTNNDKLLDLDEDFTQEAQEVIKKPEINIEDREVSVSPDMACLEI